MSMHSLTKLVLTSLLSVLSTLVCLISMWNSISFFISTEQASSNTSFNNTTFMSHAEADSLLWLLSQNLIVFSTFICQHSVMATKRWKSAVDYLGLAAIERLIYVIATSCVLEFVLRNWQRSPYTIWHLDVSISTVSWLAFFGFHFIIWSVLFGSILLIDVNELLGLKQVYYYWKGYESPMKQKSHGQQRLFRHMRHSGLTCFILLLLIHPHMSADRLLMFVMMTVYMILRFDVDKEDHSYLEQSFLTKRDESGHNYDEKLEKLTDSVTKLYLRTFAQSPTEIKKLGEAAMSFQYGVGVYCDMDQDYPPVMQENTICLLPEDHTLPSFETFWKSEPTFLDLDKFNHDSPEYQLPSPTSDYSMYEEQPYTQTTTRSYVDIDPYRHPSPGSVGSDYRSDASDPGTTLTGDDTTARCMQGRRTHSKQKGRIRLAQFLHQLLADSSKQNSDIIKWLDEGNGVFKIVDSKKVAYLWGLEKNNTKMTFASMSRGIRDRKNDGSFVSLSVEEKKAFPKKLVFKFGPHTYSSQWG